MKGFVMRHLLLLRNYLPAVALVVTAAAVTSFAVKGELPLYTAIIIGDIFLTLRIAYRDEHSRWNALACTMPVRRGVYVLSSYFIALLIAIIEFAVAFGIETLRERLQQDVLPPVAAQILPLALLMCVFVLSLTMPAIEKWGAKAASFVAAALILLIGGGGGFLIALLSGESELSITLTQQLDEAINLVGGKSVLTVLIAACSLVMLTASYLLSVSVREKREF